MSGIPGSQQQRQLRACRQYTAAIFLADRRIIRAHDRFTAIGIKLLHPEEVDPSSIRRMPVYGRHIEALRVGAPQFG